MAKITLKTLYNSQLEIQKSVDRLAVAVAKGFEAVDKRFMAVDERFDRLEYDLEDIKLRLDNKVDKIDTPWFKNNSKDWPQFCFMINYSSSPDGGLTT